MDVDKGCRKHLSAGNFDEDPCCHRDSREQGKVHHGSYTLVNKS